VNTSTSRVRDSGSETGMSVTDAVRGRFSARAFTERSVDAQLLRRILKTASQSPSGGNLQPWHIDVLGGETLVAFKALIRERMRTTPQGEGPGYEIYPKDLFEPYRSRRWKCGEDMYATMGIARDQRPLRRAFIAGNFQFWNAPIGMFFSIDTRMGPPQWSDLGIYLQTLMLLAREEGLDTCAQEAWSAWHATVGEFLDLPPQRMLFCGLAMGYAEAAHPVNGLRTERAPLEEFVTFHTA
jgi:nitroreductase